MNILVDLQDEIIEKYKLTSNDVLFLCWLINFYNSGHAKSIRDGSDYYIWVSCKKVLNDIKTFQVTEREVKRWIQRFVKLNLISRKIVGNKAYLMPNMNKLFNYGIVCQECLTEEDIKVIEDMQACHGCQTIIYYDSNYIKILINNDRVKYINGDEFLERLKEKVKDKLSETLFELIFHISKVDLIADKLIIVNVSCSTLIKKYEDIFKPAILEVVNELT